MAGLTEKKLTYLKTTKAAIRDAIVAKGQTVADTDTFRSYANKIKAIASGSGDVEYVDGVDPYYQKLAETLMLRDASFLGDQTTLSLKGFVKSDGSSLGNLPSYSFAGFKNVDYMVFDSLMLINENALLGCERLKILDITAGPMVDLVGITANAISGCTALESVIFRSGGTPLKYASVNNATGANDTFYVYVPSADYDTIIGNLSSSSNIPPERYRKLEDYPEINFWNETYTVNFYDGEELVETKTVRYGQKATSSYKKEGYKLIEWSPAPDNVTSDMDCYGSWAPAKFADATWEEIAALIDTGKISGVYAVGDTKDVTLTYADGTTEDITWAISDFGTSKIKGGNNGLGLIMAHALKNEQKMGGSGDSYHASTLSTWLNKDFYNALPENLRNLIKEKDIFLSMTYQKCWLPSLKELGISNSVFIDIDSSGAMPLFSSNDKRKRTLGKDGSTIAYWTRTSKASGSTQYFAVINTSGTFTASNASHGTHPAQSKGVVVGICL